MASPPTIDRQTFLAHLRQSGLLADAQVDRVDLELPETNRGRLVARALVERGLLTRFQAERLLAGRSAGFLLGQYRILDEIGRGGMGRVYKAEHRTMGRVVALKVLSASLLQTDRAQDLFLREVRAAARLSHPNIVTAFDANVLNGRSFLVLEYVDGPNLDQLVRQQGPLPVGQACDYVRQVAMGLGCAHALGMVHRDIKPANLLVQGHGADGRDMPGLVKIGDFGLARLHSREAYPAGGSLGGTLFIKENTVMGTPDYLSPEQARDLHNTDIRSDLYSLGCTFYFLLAGEVPFPAETALEKLIRHTTEEPVPVARFRPDVPAPVLAILDRLMAKRPEVRFQTPAELATALEPYAVSGPIPWAPRPPSVPFLDETGSAPPCSPATPGADVDALHSSSELSAMNTMVSRDLTPTAPAPPAPLVQPLVYRQKWTPHRRRERRKVLLAVLAGLAVVGGALAVCALLSYLLAG